VAIVLIGVQMHLLHLDKFGHGLVQEPTHHRGLVLGLISDRGDSQKVKVVDGLTRRCECSDLDLVPGILTQELKLLSQVGFNGIRFWNLEYFARGSCLVKDRENSKKGIFLSTLAQSWEQKIRKEWSQTSWQLMM